MSAIQDMERKKLLAQKIASRVTEYKREIANRKEIIRGWKSLRFQEDANQRNEFARFLFVVFLRKNLDDLEQAEDMIIIKKRFVRNEFVLSCFAEDDGKFPNDVATNFVKDSINHRVKNFEKEQMTYELLCDGYEAISLASNILFEQLDVVFGKDCEGAIREFECNILLNPTLVFSTDLKYVDNSGATLPDGTHFHGLYRIIPCNKLIKWCQYDTDYLFVPVFLEFTEWAFIQLYTKNIPIQSLAYLDEHIKASSKESVIFNISKQFLQPSNSLSATMVGEQGAKRTESRENGLASGGPRVENQGRREHTSFMAAASVARKRRLISGMIPEEFFAVWDKLNMDSGPENVARRPVFGVQTMLERAETSLAQLSVVESKSSSESVANDSPFHLQYLEYCRIYQKSPVAMKESMGRIRQLLVSLVEVIFDQKEYKSAIKILPLVQLKMTEEWIMMFSFFVKIHEELGSLSFILFLLRSKRFDLE